MAKAIGQRPRRLQMCQALCAKHGKTDLHPHGQVQTVVFRKKDARPVTVGSLCAFREAGLPFCGP